MGQAAHFAMSCQSYYATAQSYYATTRGILNELFEPQDFKLSTWMAFGATLLLISQSYLPPSVSNFLPLVLLGGRIAKMIIDTQHLHTGCYTSLMRGRWTATLPEPENPVDINSGSDGVVMFVLGARINQSVSLPLSRSRPWQKFL